MNSSLRASQMRRMYGSLLLFFLVGVGIPLFLTFTVFWSMFETTDHFPLPQAAGWLCCLILFPVIATRIIQRQSRIFAAETFDPLFASMKLTSGPYLSGREYHGTYNGRRVDMYVTPKTRRMPVETIGHHTALTYYNGHTIDIYLEAPLHIRAAISNGVLGFGLKLSASEKTRKLRETSIGSSPLLLVGEDHSWMDAFVASEVMRSALIQLFTPEMSKSPVSLELTAQAAHLHARIHKALLTEDRLRAWMQILETTCVEAQKNTTPHAVVQESALERTLRTDASAWIKKVARKFWIGFSLFIAVIIVVIYFVVRPYFG